MAQSSDPRARVSLVVAAIAAGALHLSASLAVLVFGYPNEDALILFKFAKNVATRHAIVFSPGGPPAEGATDFLWMLALAAGHAAGIDVAVMAAMLNAAGCAVCTVMFFSGPGAGSAGKERWIAALTVAWLVASPVAIASYVGFGTMAFSALALWVFLAALEGDARALARLPIAAGVLAFFRPDGAILAIGFVLTSAPRARRLGVARTYGVRAVATAVGGAAYFFWRASYFHSWLPLPLYVKRHFDGAPGVRETFEWLLSVVPIGLLLGALALIARRAALTPRPPADRARLLVALAPFAVHVASFIPTVQTQNIANRFQGPATIALMCLAVRHLRRAADVAPARHRAGILALIALVFVPAWGPFDRVLLDAFRGDYLEAFAPALGRLCSFETRIATTEAGNIPFWNDATVLDLVGLNSPETARRAPSQALLESFHADVIMLHPAGALDTEEMLRRLGSLSRVSIETPLRPFVPPARRAFLADPLPMYRYLHAENVKVAPVATIAFLDVHASEYDVYIVRSRTRGGFHLYAFRRAWTRRDDAVRALDASCSIDAQQGGSYLRSLHAM